MLKCAAMYQAFRRYVWGNVLKGSRDGGACSTWSGLRAGERTNVAFHAFSLPRFPGPELVIRGVCCYILVLQDDFGQSMLAKIQSGAVYGVDAYPVEIEVNTGGGETRVVIVGLPDAAVRESIDRVWTAMSNSGFHPPIGRTTINLAPADKKKEGPSFDLPIALGMLAAEEEIEDTALEGVCVVGELALGGEVRKVRGVLPIALMAREMGCRALLVPVENAEEAAVAKGLDVYPVQSLRDAADYLNRELDLQKLDLDTDLMFSENNPYDLDFEDIKGQESAKRALEVAVSGGHNILLIGPPGTGKSMLSKRIPSILPSMTLGEALETTKIHSIAGVLEAHQPLIARRPFRSPHHTVSDAGLLGGGSHPMPGEVSLAHHGVLFLDELPEFSRSVLEVMRQPIEDGSVAIARAAASVTFPCRFMLAAAMNPCPCGYYTDPHQGCRCTQNQIQKYRNKISGPLLDRIDIHVEVPTLRYEELASMEKGESSDMIRDRVIETRRIQQQRFEGNQRVHCNAEMGAKDLRSFCLLEEEAEDLLKMAITELNFSARAYDRILKVSRTIGDLDGSDMITTSHVSEAIQYRSLDRELWV